MEGKDDIDENLRQHELFVGRAVMGKSFLINVITEYIKRNLKYHVEML